LLASALAASTLGASAEAFAVSFAASAATGVVAGVDVIEAAGAAAGLGCSLLQAASPSAAKATTSMARFIVRPFTVLDGNDNHIIIDYGNSGKRSLAGKFTMENKTARFTVLIDPRKKQMFEEICAAQDLTPSQVVRQLMREYIIEHAGNRELPAWLLKAANKKVPHN
jgi:hypothetical protein